ncbi:MAG: PAS domain S-box protein [Chloroflexota bacterium]
MRPTSGNPAEDKFRALLESAPDAMVIVNQQGIITLVNSQTETLFGYGREELLNQPVEILIPESFRSRHPAPRNRYIADPHVRGMGVGRELYALRKNGSKFPVEISLSPIQTEEGVLIASAIRDISERKKQERVLRFHASLQENVSEAVIATDVEFRIQSWNRAAEDIYGWRAEEVIGKLTADVLQTEYKSPQERERILQAFLIEGHWESEFRQKRKDGRELYILGSTTLFKDKQGVPFGIVSVNHDITERHQIEEALDQSEKNLRLITQNSPDIIYILDLKQQRATYLNRTEFLGYSQNELESSGSLLHAIYPEDKEPVLTHWREVTSEGATKGTSLIEYRLRDKSGQWQWIKSRETIFASIADGKPTQVLVTLTVITERKQAEAALRESEERYRALFNQIEDAIFIHDNEGNLLDVNQAACERLGYSRDELLRMKTVEIDAPEYGAKFYQRLQQQLETGKLLDIEGIHIARDGHRIPVLVNSRRINYGGKEAVIAVARDMTEPKRVEQQTLELATERERIKLLADFIRDVSHDFRTPLASIGLSAYMLLRKSDLDQRQQHFDRVEQEVKHINRLIGRFLLMARLDAGVELDFHDVKVDTLVEEVVTQFSSIAQAKRVRLTVQLSANLPLIHVDEQQILQSLGEILNNAITFTPEGGEVIIQADVIENIVVVSVHDTGPGISAEHLPYIFRRLYRVDTARSAEDGAVGLGLSIAKRIVELHQGSIGAESVVGEGSIIWVTLPFA